MGKKKNKNQGFTLVEILVTLTIFSVGILAIYNLSIANLRAANDNYQRSLAANLAREGVELVRNTRDSNWLKIEANATTTAPGFVYHWDYGLDDALGFFVVNYMGTTPLPLGCVPQSFTGCFEDQAASIYFDGSHYANGVVAGATYTGMKRVIGLKAICRDTSKNLLENGIVDKEIVSNDNFCSSGTKIGIQVTVRVRWGDGSKSKEIEVVDNIYNWR